MLSHQAMPVLLIISIAMAYLARLHYQARYDKEYEKERIQFQNIRFFRENEDLGLVIKILIFIITCILYFVISGGYLSPFIFLIPFFVLLVMELIDGWLEYKSTMEKEQTIVNKVYSVVFLGVFIVSLFLVSLF
ncbi:MULTISPECIES: hypothetical protein [Bacillaceae]|uniref:DUF4181 domain-containing protein n=1 Tax=Evansella alkalicola TaxID=745819 RepID=A0ABS6JVB9_9BACI|nr:MULTISPECIES: hypothetical protein [Bacillaceae]MBU9722335.1 hypothetical protein [Bacillus alkalicola]